MPSVLIAESNGLLAKYFSVVVESVGYSVCGIAATSEEAVGLAVETRPDLVLLDEHLAGRQDGVQAARQLKRQMALRVVLMTDDQAPAASARLQTANADAVLVKPVGAQLLWDTLQRHCA